MTSISLKNITTLSIKDLWNHSVTTAILMREMGKRLNNDNESDHLFIIGLLHDIGVVVFDQFFSEDFQEVLNTAISVERKDFCKIEQKIIGFDHGEVGGMLLTRWNFPEMISLPVANHHHSLIKDEGLSKETMLLKLGDIISHSDIQTEETTKEMDDEQHLIIEYLGVPNDFVREIMNFKKSVKDEIESFFNAVI